MACLTRSSKLPRAFKFYGFVCFPVLSSNNIWSFSRQSLLTTYFSQGLLTTKMERRWRSGFCCPLHYRAPGRWHSKELTLQIWDHEFELQTPSTKSQVWFNTLYSLPWGSGDSRVGGAHWTAILAYLASSKLVRHTISTNKVGGTWGTTPGLPTVLHAHMWILIHPYTNTHTLTNTTISKNYIEKCKAHMRYGRILICQKPQKYVRKEIQANVIFANMMTKNFP